jgi:hypothetical protein
MLRSTRLRAEMAKILAEVECARRAKPQLWPGGDGGSKNGSRSAAITSPKRCSPDALTPTLHEFGFPIDADGSTPDKCFNGAAADQPRK